MLEKYKISSCAIGDISYPMGMKNLTGMPSILYFRGDITIVNNRKSVAVIGSRRTSSEGLRLSYYAGRKVAEAGMNLVNGLALGCDTEAMRGAIHAGGKCVAVMPCGLDQIQPRSNYRLAEEILENGGCLLSEYPIGTAVREYHYVARDRLQSAISQGVWVIEAQEKSGTMHTVNFATKQCKRLACYYHTLVNNATGNKILEAQGRASVLKSNSDIQRFLEDISKEETYEQIKLDF